MLKVLAILLLISTIYCDDALFKGIIDKSIKYGSQNGLQLLLVDNADAKFFCSLTGSKTVVNAECHLLLVEAKEDLDKKNGAFAGIGFGSTMMYKSDMIIFQYWTKRDKQSMSSDYWVGSTDRYLKLDTDYDKTAGKNHVTQKAFHAESINVGGFKTHLHWSADKSLENLDAFDWQDFSNWQTNNGDVFGAWGYNNPDNGNMTGHKFRPKNYKLIDGQGLNVDSPVTLKSSEDGDGGNSNFLGFQIATLTLLLSLILV